MGVTGLWQLLQDAGRPVSLETLEGKVLAVDISIWLHQAIKGMRDKHGNPVPNAHLISVFNKVCKLLFYRIKPVFVFDGGVPALKKKTLAGRRERKENAKIESEKMASRLLMTSLKSYALQQMTGEGSSEPINLPTTSSAPDMFELPPLPIRRNSLEELSSEDEAFEGYFESLLDIDIDSSDFKVLPTELQHEVLTEIKDRRKMNNFTKTKELPEDSNDFSAFQMNKLLKQNKLSSRIENVRKEMNEQQTGEITGAIDGGLYGDYEVESRRVASDNTSHLVLVKGLGKKKKQMELAQRKEKERLEDLKKYFENIKSENESDDFADSRTNEELRAADFDNRDEDMYLSNVKMGTDAEQKLSHSSSFPHDSVQGTSELLPVYPQDSCDSSTLSKDGIKRKHDSQIKSEYTPTSSKVVRKEIDVDVLVVPEDSTTVTHSSMLDMNLCVKKVDLNFKKNFISDNNINKTKDIKEGSLSSTDLIPSKSISNAVNGEEFGSQKNVTLVDFNIDHATNNTSESEDNKSDNKSIHKSDNESNYQNVLNNQDNKTTTNVENVDIVSTAQTKNNLPSVEKSDKSQTNIFMDSTENQNVVDNISDKDCVDRLYNLTVSNNKDASRVDMETVAEGEADIKSSNGTPHIPQEVEPSEEKAVDAVDVSSSDEEEDDFIEIPDHPESELLEGMIDEADQIADRPDDDWIEEEETSHSLANDFNNILQDGLENFQQSLQAEAQTLQAEHGKQQRMAVSMTDHIYVQVQELLGLFGLPFVISPMEAEAQCAYLETSGLTHGTITDDSDIWLFGGRRVYKNFFNQSKLVEFFKLEDFVEHFDLDRDQLINIALLCGSDYTPGIQGVGPATATGILEEFPGEGLAGLKVFKKWWKLAHKEPILISDTKLRSKLRRVVLLPGFPDQVVVDAYLEPEVDDSKEAFTWGMPDLDSIRDNEHLRWSQAKTDEVLVPVIKQLSKTQSQPRITGFFSPESHELAARQKANKGKRKTMQKTVMAGQRKPRKGAMSDIEIKKAKQLVNRKNVVCLSESSSSDGESESEEIVMEITKNVTTGTKTEKQQKVSNASVSKRKLATAKSSKVIDKSADPKSSKYTKRALSSHMPL